MATQGGARAWVKYGSEYSRHRDWYLTVLMFILSPAKRGKHNLSSGMITPSLTSMLKPSFTKAKKFTLLWVRTTTEDRGQKDHQPVLGEDPVRTFLLKSPSG